MVVAATRSIVAVLPGVLLAMHMRRLGAFRQQLRGTRDGRNLVRDVMVRTALFGCDCR